MNTDTKITPETKRSALPRTLSEKQVKQLDANEFYPAFVYTAALGLAKPVIALRDYEKGTIDPEEVRFKGEFVPFAQRKPGHKAMILIKGREIRRIWRVGRTPGRFAKGITAALQQAEKEVA